MNRRNIVAFAVVKEEKDLTIEIFRIFKRGLGEKTLNQRAYYTR